MIKYKPKKQLRYSDFLKSIKKTENIEQEMTKKILLIDGLNLFYRTFASVNMMDDKGKHVGGIYGSIRGISSAINKLNPSRVIIIFDGRGGSKFRKAIYPEYKVKRGGFSKLNRTYKWATDEEEKESFNNQISRFVQYLDYMPITSISVDNIEADDGIAYLKNKVFTDSFVYIMSTDKDYYQLIDERCNVWSPTKRIIYDMNKVVDEFGIHPTNFTIFRAIDGDNSDNIPGVKGVGPKTLQKICPELSSEKKITEEDFLITAEKNIDIRGYKIIFDNKEIFKRNFKLMQLYEAPISGTIKSEMLDVIKNQKIPLFNMLKLRKMLIKDKLYKIISELSRWYSSFSRLDFYARGFNKQLNEIKE